MLDHQYQHNFVIRLKEKSMIRKKVIAIIKSQVKKELQEEIDYLLNDVEHDEDFDEDGNPYDLLDAFEEVRNQIYKDEHCKKIKQNIQDICMVLGMCREVTPKFLRYSVITEGWSKYLADYSFYHNKKRYFIEKSMQEVLK